MNDKILKYFFKNLNYCYRFNHINNCHFLTIRKVSQTIVTYFTMITIVTDLTIQTIVTYLTIRNVSQTIVTYFTIITIVTDLTIP